MMTLCPNCAITQKQMRFRKVSGVLIRRWNIFRHFGNVWKSSENRQNSSELAGKIQIMTRRKSDAFDSSEKVCRYMYRTFMSISWKWHGLAWKTATLETDEITTTQICDETATSTKPSANKIVKYWHGDGYLLFRTRNDVFWNSVYPLKL